MPRRWWMCNLGAPGDSITSQAFTLAAGQYRLMWVSQGWGDGWTTWQLSITLSGGASGSYYQTVTTLLGNPGLPSLSDERSGTFTVTGDPIVLSIVSSGDAGSHVGVDNFRFAPPIIPEASQWSLLSRLGLLAFEAWRRFRK